MFDPPLEQDVDTKLGLFPIPNYVDGVLPRQVASFLASKWTPDHPLGIPFDLPKVLFNVLFLGRKIEPAVAAPAVPASVDDAQLEALVGRFSAKVEHLQQILKERRALREADGEQAGAA